MHSLALTLACGKTFLLGGCAEPQTVPEPKLLETRQVNSGIIFATFEPANDFRAMEDAAKTACGDEAICKVVIFRADTVLPLAFPITDREVDQQIGNYSFNRNTGLNELLVTCPLVTDAPPTNCMAQG